jgi:hypothetical protein
MELIKETWKLESSKLVGLRLPGISCTKDEYWESIQN